MALLCFLLFIASLLFPTVVLASDGAGGWEAVLMYDCYRLDGLRDESQRNIAVGCRGNNGGRCNFFQFLAYINPRATVVVRINGVRTTLPKVNENSPDIPTGFDADNPDPKQASEVMTWRGQPNPNYNPNAPPNPNRPEYFKGYEGTYDQKTLLGPMFNDGTSQPRETDPFDHTRPELTQDKHGHVFRKLIMTAARTNKDHPEASKELLKRIDSVLPNIIHARVAENAQSLIRDLMTHANGLGPYKNLKPAIEPHTTTATEPTTGKTYDALDTTRLMDDINNHPSLSAEEKTKVNGIVSKYAIMYVYDRDLSEKPNSSGVTHNRDIVTFRQMSVLVKKGLPTCGN